MFKKVISAVSGVAVLASALALQLTPVFAEEVLEPAVDEAAVDEAAVDEPAVDDYEDIYDIGGDLPEGYTLAEPPYEEGDYYYDDYGWYEDDEYYYDWQEYNWEVDDLEGMEVDDWSEEDYEAYWYDYEWEEGAWEDMAYGYYDLYYEVDELVWLLEEIDMIYEEYAFAEMEVPQDIAEGLTIVSDEALKILNHEKLAPLYDLARDAIEGSMEYPYEEQAVSFDAAWDADYSADIDFLLQAIWDFWDQDPYAPLDYAWDNLYGYYSVLDVRSEIEWMLEDVVVVGTFIEALASLEIDDFRVQWAIDDLQALIPEAKATLEEMLALVDQDTTGSEDDDYEMLGLYWDVLDGMEMVFFDNMDVVVGYLNEHPDQLEELYSLAPESTDMILAWVEEPLEPEYDFDENFEKYYGDIEYEYEDGEDFMTVFESTFEEDLYAEIIREISAQLMAELAPYFEDMIAKAIISNIMNYMDVLGEEIANAYLKNQAAILEKLDFDISKTGNLEDELEELGERAKATVIPDSYKDELERALEELRNRVEFGAIDAEISDLIDKVTAILDKIDYENIFGEHPVEFYDVPFDEELVWYWDDVSVARNEGIISGYTDEDGDLTGYFKPSNNVTYAEALKMIMEAAEYEPIVQTDEVNEPWYQGYLRSLDNLGFERVDSEFTADWNASAPRGDILVMANEILGIALVDYVAGTFPDVSADDKLADDAMASYLAGIFTGHSETGELRPNDYIDRASFSKVINTALEYLSGINFVDELGEFRSMLAE